MTTISKSELSVRDGLIRNHSSAVPHVIRFVCVAAVCLCPLIMPSATAQPTAESLASRLQPLIEAHEGEVAVSVRHLKEGTEFHHRADAVMPTASLIKFPVMIETYRQIESGRLDPGAMIELRAKDKVPGSGILTKHFSDGTQISLRNAVHLMIALSDNTATNLVIDQIGIESTAATMQKLGFPETKLHSKVFRGNTTIFPERSKQYGLGSTCSRDIVQLLSLLNSGELISADACSDMMQHLLECESRSKLPRFLLDDVRIAHKTGSVSASRCDAGILLTKSGPIAVCVLTSKNSDKRWTDDNAADVLCGRVGQIVYDHFNPRGEAAGPKESLQIGDFGQLVEDVQRTLNARMDPSAQLSVDGDFGPATLKALIRFQHNSKIAETGVVDHETWAALSPLITQDAPVLPPEQVNQQVLPVAAADDPHGPPAVSCRAWVIADADSGEILWSDNAQQRLPFASTTKIMTAYVVLNLARQTPGVLDETVTFSRRADQTRGSTAGIREGESLSVRELLYGLLLPSGNDASIALAEHFGNRFRGPDERTTDPLDRFVVEMNRCAHELGMSQTTYTNPHGLSDDAHLSSAADLAVLAREALKQPEFSDYVATRQRGCTLVGSGGYRRNVVWRNTNQLLGIDGFEGVKTGTTGAAGACLVSKGHRNDRELLVVVLGSASSTGRYVDTRNLYRWAWAKIDTKP